MFRGESGMEIVYVSHQISLQTVALGFDAEGKIEGTSDEVLQVNGFLCWNVDGGRYGRKVCPGQATTISERHYGGVLSSCSW